MAPVQWPSVKEKRKRCWSVFQSIQIGRFWHEILAAIQQHVVDIGQLNRPLAFIVDVRLLFNPVHKIAIATLAISIALGRSVARL